MPVTIKQAEDKKPIRLNGRGLGIKIVANVSGPVPEEDRLELTLFGKQRIDEFMWLINRALSTNEDPIPWALSLMDKLTGTPPPQVPVDRPIPESNYALWNDKAPDPDLPWEAK